MVKIGIELVPERETMETVKYIKHAEENGFQHAWVTDHYNNRNVYATLAVAAANTSKIRLGPGVTNPFLVYPAVTASAVATIDEISKGRAVMGIGAGDKGTLDQLGVEWKNPLTAVKEVVEICRLLWKGEAVKYDGQMFKIKNARLSYKPAGQIPIYIGAQGPKMLALAAELGDGALINASNPKDIEPAVKIIKETLNKVGKKEFDIVAYTSFSVDENKEEAKKMATYVVAFIAAATPSVVLERHGIPESDVQQIRELIGAGKIGKAAKSVTDDMLEAFSIYGTPSECAEKMAKLVKIGVTQLVIGSPIAADKMKAIELIGKKILPTL
ncbi:MAG: 5,10-methylenetetrahydromethanopterin reductase [Candidatus Jordarchaeales archaeon]